MGDCSWKRSLDFCVSAVVVVVVVWWWYCRGRKRGEASRGGYFYGVVCVFDVWGVD